MFVLLGLLGLLGAQPLSEGLGGGQLQAYGQGIDKQAQCAVDARQLARAPVAYAADDDLIELAQSCEQECEQALQDAGLGQALGACKVLERAAGLSGHGEE